MIKISWVRWYIIAVQALGRIKRRDYKLEANPSHTASFFTERKEKETD